MRESRMEPFMHQFCHLIYTYSIIRQQGPKRVEWTTYIQTRDVKFPDILKLGKTPFFPPEKKWNFSGKLNKTLH